MPFNPITKGRANPELWTMEGANQDILNRSGLLGTVQGPGGFGAQATATLTGGVLNTPTVNAAGTYNGGVVPLCFANATTGSFTANPVLVSVMKGVTYVGAQNAGSGYAPSDTITLAGGTSTTATVLTVTNTKLVSLAGNAAGSGYNIGDTITLSGGTATVSAIVTVTRLGLATPTIVSAGSGYAANDTVNLAGGTYFLSSVSGPSTAQAQVTVATTKLVSIAVGNNGATGSGYKSGDTITLAGGTSSTAAVLTVQSVDSAGRVTAVTISTAGSYTVNATTWAQASTSGTGTGAVFVSGSYGVNSLTVAQAGSYTAIPTGNIAQAFSSGSGSGLTVTAVWGVAAFNISTAGVYTANTATFTQASSTGNGTGATFQTALYGVNTCSISTAGAYTVTPNNPVSQTSSSGSGTGAQHQLLWGVASVTVTSGGTGTATVAQVNFVLAGANNQGQNVLPSSTNIVSYAGTGADTTEDTLLQFIIKSGTLFMPGDSLFVTAGGVLGADGNNKTVKIYFGPQSFTSGTQTGNASSWWLDMQISVQQVTTSGALLSILFTGMVGSTTLTSSNVIVPVVLSQDFLVKVTGTNGTATANDVVANFLNVQMAA